MQLCISLLIACSCYMIGLITGAMIVVKPNKDIEKTAIEAVENTRQALGNLNHSTEIADKFRIKFEQCLRNNEKLNKELWLRNAKRPIQER